MFGLGVPELLIIALLILLFFGAKRLPGIGTGLGKTMKEIRDIKKDMSPDKKTGKEFNKFCNLFVFHFFCCILYNTIDAWR